MLVKTFQSRSLPHKMWKLRLACASHKATAGHWVSSGHSLIARPHLARVTTLNMFVFKEINTFAQQGLYYVLYLAKVTVKSFINNVTKMPISNKCHPMELSIHQRILKQNAVSTKILSSTTVFNIDNNNKKKVLEQQISILEWFLKDHVTLKTGVIAIKIILY